MRLSLMRFSDADEVEGRITDRQRADHDHEVRQAHLAAARRQPPWTEIPETRLVRRGPFLVDSETDGAFVYRRGHVFGPGSASIEFVPNNTPMTFYVDRSDNILFIERHPGAGTWSEIVARKAGARSRGTPSSGSRASTTPTCSTGHRGSPGRCARGSLRFKPADLDIPLVVDHDMSKEIGRVRKIEEIKDVDGRWYVALATVTKKPPWLKRHTGASMESKPLATMELNGWRIVQRALVTEVTATSPAYEPRDIGTKVLLVDEIANPESSPQARPTTPPRGEPARQVIYHHPHVSRRSERAKDLLDDEELRRRRPDYVAARGLRCDFETVLRSLQREISGPSLEDMVRDHRLTRAA